MNGCPHASRVWVVIAAYNEENGIGGVVRSVRSLCPDVVVVDDGSNDATARAARGAGARVVRHPVNLGQGAALGTGIEFALRNGAQVIVTFDADGQHDPANIPVLVRALETKGVEVALGSRFLGEAIGIPYWRRCVLRLAIWFTFLTTGLRLTDAHNGLRALTRRAAQRIRITQNRMAHASEIVTEVARLRLRYVEVPVRVRYTPHSLKKGQTLASALHVLWDLLSGRIYR